MRAAQAAAKSDYAARNAALNREAARLKRQNQAIAAVIGELRANTIRASGTYVVGYDIKRAPGTPPVTAAPAVVIASYATFGSINVSDILSHNNFDGAVTVDLSGAYAFQINGPCKWVRVPS